MNMLQDRHAYLIMAYDHFELLDKLLKMIDDERNDIYIHIDKKSGDVPYEKIRSSLAHSDIFFLDRKDIRWGSYSLIECELDLLKQAVKRKYMYYHLISGVDLPIKTQDYIHDFFEKNAGKEFIHVEHTDRNNIRWLCERYHFFAGRQGREKKGFYVGLEKISLGIQKLFHVNRLRNEKNMALWKGSNWFSITNQFAEYVVSREKWIKKHFRYTRTCDEVFLQTILANSEFKDNLFYQKNDDNYIANMRYIDWNRGKPYVFREGDLEELKRAPHLFARKFDEKISGGLIDEVFNYVVNNN